MLLDCNSVISKPHYTLYTLYSILYTHYKSFSTDSPVGPFVGLDDHIVRVVNRKGNACLQARVHRLLASLVGSVLIYQFTRADKRYRKIQYNAFQLSVSNNNNTAKFLCVTGTLGQNPEIPGSFSHNIYWSDNFDLALKKWVLIC